MIHFSISKVLTIVGICFAGQVALADQCAYITKQEALDAAKLIRVGDVITSYCEPCDNSQKKTIEVTSVAAAPVGYENYWGLFINGENQDLAYTFVSTSSSVQANLSKLVGCSSRNVSDFIRRASVLQGSK